MPGFGKDAGSGQAILRQLAILAIMALAMTLATLGLMYYFSSMDLPSTAILLLVFALALIVSVVLLDRASDDLAASLMGGAAIALSVTIFIGSLILGVSFLVNDLKQLPGPDVLLTGFAICLIASLLINRLTLKLA